MRLEGILHKSERENAREKTKENSRKLA